MTMAISIPLPRPHPNKFFQLVLLLIMFGLIMMSMAWAHAAGHPESGKAKDCYKQFGSKIGYIEYGRTPEYNTLHLFCIDPITNIVYDIMCRMVDGTWRAFNAFAPKGGEINAVNAWITRKPGYWTDPNKISPCRF